MRAARIVASLRAPDGYGCADRERRKRQHANRCNAQNPFRLARFAANASADTDIRHRNPLTLNLLFLGAPNEATVAPSD
jgi:hypothetical protein